MFRILGQSRIALNRHIGSATRYANNMRLYEATGMGALLLTDHKENLAEIFEPGSEVLAYRSVAECVELARYYLEHELERQAIARAGRRRVLRDHTYAQRAQEMETIIDEYLHGRRAPAPITGVRPGRAAPGNVRCRHDGRRLACDANAVPRKTGYAPGAGRDAGLASGKKAPARAGTWCVIGPSAHRRARSD